MSDVVIGVRFKDDGSVVFEKIGTAAGRAADGARSKWAGLGAQIGKLSPELGNLASAFTTKLGAVGLAAASVAKLWNVASEAINDSLEKGSKKAGVVAEANIKAANDSASAWAKSYERAAATMGKYADVTSVFTAKGGNEIAAKAISQSEGLDLQGVMRAMIKGKEKEMTDDEVIEAIKAGGLAQRTGRGSMGDVSARAMDYMKATGKTRGKESSAQLIARSAGFDGDAKLSPEDLDKARKRFEEQQDQVEEEYNKMVRDRKIVDKNGVFIEGIKYQRKQWHPGMAKSFMWDEDKKAAWDKAEQEKVAASYVDKTESVTDADGRTRIVSRGAVSYTARPFAGSDPEEVARQIEAESQRLGHSERGKALARFGMYRAGAEVARFDEGVNRGVEGANRDKTDTVADFISPGARDHLRQVRELQDKKAAIDARYDAMKDDSWLENAANSNFRKGLRGESNAIQDQIDATVNAGVKAGFYNFNDQTKWINSNQGFVSAMAKPDGMQAVKREQDSQMTQAKREEMQARAMEAAAKILEETRRIQEINDRRMQEATDSMQGVNIDDAPGGWLPQLIPQPVAP